MPAALVAPSRASSATRGASGPCRVNGIGTRQVSAQVVSGQPHGSIVRAVRTDGFLTESRLSMMPAVAPDGQRIVIGIHSAIRIPDRATIRAIQEQTLDAAAYVSDLARELSELAARTGLPRLADSLEAVAGEAGAIMIEAQARRRPN